MYGIRLTRSVSRTRWGRRLYALAGKKVEATGFIVGSADARRLVLTSKRVLTKGAYEISFKRGGKPHTEALTLR